ncbi:MAG: hypothetical protein OXH08_07505 [Gammaproteobacteria bacterium]|nr:hypothetical protein [Gammaproteobacteria bacterium]MDE0651872.1 hypothetical protein [Gammaproteobacteria bacterium]
MTRTQQTDSVFERLPDQARLWVFASERPLSQRESAALLERVDGFLSRWKAHGAPLAAGRAWLYDRFLAVAVDESVTPPSGCSIDALVHMLKELEAEIGSRLVDNTPVYYRSPRGVERVSRGGFRKLADAGEVTLDTPVFNNTITRLEEFRGGEWEGPARHSWQGRAFFRV